MNCLSVSEAARARKLAAGVLFGLLALMTATENTAQEPAACPEGRIARIEVRSESVFGDSAGPLLSKVYAAGNWLHVETGEEFIRRELIVREGDCLDRFKLGESERLLRLYPFLQSASVQATDREDGDYDVQVVTRDDWSLRVEPRFKLDGGWIVKGLTVAERNLAGSGRTVSLSFLDRSDQDEVGIAFFDPQFLQSRWNLLLATARTEEGWLLNESVGYPFVGLVGRWAAFEEAMYGELWHRYSLGDPNRRRELILPYTQKAAQLGGAVRLIAPQSEGKIRQGTYGLSLSYEHLSYGTSFLGDTLDGADLELQNAADDLSGLRERETLRLNLLLGVRSLRFVQRNGVSTLRAEEDVALGAEADLVLGIANKSLGSSESRLLGAIDLYGGARIVGGWFSLLRATVEARRDYQERRWEDIFGVVQWSNLWLLNSRNTVELTARWSAGWNATRPFQLTLGGRWGLAGLSSHRYPGGSRVVARLEDRHALFSVGRLFDLGALAFVDVGQMWENGAPFGVDSGLRASLGGGLRVASPSGTRLVYRLQVAAPIDSRTQFDDLIFIFRIDRYLGLESEPIDNQLARSRDLGLRTVAQHVR